MRTNREILDIFGEYEKIVTEINEKFPLEKLLVQWSGVSTGKIMMKLQKKWKKYLTEKILQVFLLNGI